MKIELVKWDLEHKAELCRLCNGVDRSYLSDRIPYPYQDGDAEWWIGRTLEQEGKRFMHIDTSPGKMYCIFCKPLPVRDVAYP